MTTNKGEITTGPARYVRYAIVGALALAAFFGAYRFAQASSASAQSGASGAAVAATGGAAGGSSAGAAGSGGCCGGSTSAGSAAGGGCCGSGGSTAQVSGNTTVVGGVQKVTIDLTTGSYSPNRISAKAGIPIELDFKGPASSCNGTVVSQQLGFQQDVSNGGTIKVRALKAGNYTWTCGMGMYTGQIVVQ